MEIDKKLIFKNMYTEIDDKLKKYGKKISYAELSCFVDDICNISINSVEPLSEKETYILRKRLGVFDNGDIQSLRLICESLEETRSCERIRQILAKDYIKIISYINKQMEAKNVEFYEMQLDTLKKSDNQILNSNIIKYNLSARSFNCLRSLEIVTMRDLIRLRTDDLNRMQNIGKKSSEEIIDYVHNNGLLFSDEVSTLKFYTEEIYKQLNIENDDNGYGHSKKRYH